MIIRQLEHTRFNIFFFLFFEKIFLSFVYKKLHFAQYDAIFRNEIPVLIVSKKCFQKWIIYDHVQCVVGRGLSDAYFSTKIHSLLEIEFTFQLHLAFCILLSNHYMWLLMYSC